MSVGTALVLPLQNCLEVHELRAACIRVCIVRPSSVIHGAEEVVAQSNCRAASELRADEQVTLLLTHCNEEFNDQQL